MWDQSEVVTGWGKRQQVFCCRAGDKTEGFHLKERKKR